MSGPGVKKFAIELFSALTLSVRWDRYAPCLRGGGVGFLVTMPGVVIIFKSSPFRSSRGFPLIF